VFPLDSHNMEENTPRQPPRAPVVAAIPDSSRAIVNACPESARLGARSERSTTEHDQTSLVMGKPEGPIYFECDQECAW
jgi:hypothetical protein